MKYELIFPEKVNIEGVVNPLFLYDCLKNARMAYKRALVVLKSDEDRMTRETALELLILSKYSVYVLTNLEVPKMEFRKLQPKGKYFAEWVDCNLDVIPEDMREFALRQYCTGYKLMFCKDRLKEVEGTSKSSSVIGEMDEDDFDD